MNAIQAKETAQQMALPIHQIDLPTPWPAVGPVHVYVVRQDPVTIIDTGVHTPESREALEAGLKQLGLGLGDVRRVLLTHAHLDHYGQAGLLQAAGAEVLMHPDEVGKAETPDWWTAGRGQALTEAGVPQETQQVMEHYWQQGRKLALPLDGWQPLADGQRIEFEGGHLEAVHLPGHALGHLGFWDAEDRTLVGGDHLLMGITPNPIMEPLPPGRHGGAPHAPARALTLGLFLDALDRARNMAPARVLPGHGPVITEAGTVVSGYREKHERRLTRLAERLAGAGMTPHALCREIYPRVREWDVFLALSEVLAHLDLLVVRGRATAEPGRDGRVYRAL
jgi:glyoxylase-like metal-dependent hydrolase (beta-lactamase superfamily II)